MGYPDEQEELKLLELNISAKTLPVIVDVESIMESRKKAEAIFVSKSVSIIL